MRSPRLLFAVSGFLAMVMMPSAKAQDPPADPNVEVLTRGPVHEAYANATTSQPAAGLIAPKQPPDPIEELPPDEKPAGDNVQWISGYWAWDEDKADFLWVSGFWRVPPPDRSWMPGLWRDMGNGQWQWTSGFWNVTAQSEVQYLPPPPAPVEVAPPPSPGQDYVYAPGTWVYRDTHYVWRPGFWYVFRPGWVYVPAHYSWTPYGHIYVEGYWDYPLRQRGVLFTPVYFGAGVYVQPGFVYSPRYVVYDDALYGALFVRPGGGYYFGDYFEPRYATLGYRSWLSVSISIGPRDPYPYRYDPLFAYYRRANGPTWAVQVNNVYIERTRFPDQRPPRTLVQQNIVINNVTNKTVINNVTMVASVTNVDKTKINNLTKITPQQRQQAVVAARETRAASVQRAKTEAQLAPGGRPGQPLAPRTVKLDVPKTATPATPVHPDKAPPQLPHTPARPATPAAAPSPAAPKPGVTPVAPPAAGPAKPGTPPPPPSATKAPAVPPPPPHPTTGPMPPGANQPGTHPLPPGQQPQHQPPPQHPPPPGQKPAPNERDRERDKPDRP